jgi:hypothetical protein
MSERRPSPPALLAPRGRTPAALATASFLAGLAAAVLVTFGATLALLQPILAQRLAGSMTVVISGRMDNGALESSDAAAARAREVLSGLPGVAGVRVLEPAAIDSLLARVLRAPPSSADTGPARFLAVTFAGRGPASASTASMAHALGAEGLLFAIDDHGAWTGPCERLALLCAAVVALGLLAGLAALAALAAGAAGRRIDGAWSRLDLLAQLGAEPSRLARAVGLPMAARAALFAAAGAAAGVGLCWLRWPAASAFLPPAPPVVAGAALWLLAAGLAAGIFARRVADRRLQALFS